MAELFVNQAKEYASARPSYPPQLFQFIASKTPSHNLAWDVATGSGQAAKSLGAIYKNVIATDVSEKQLEFAAKLPNVRYQHTPSTMSISELEQKVSHEGTIDLVTIAQALHWFDLPTFYQQVKWVLKKPHGVIAAWCYNLPRVSDAVDAVLDQLYFFDSKPYWDPARQLLDNNYGSVDFPFEPVDGADHIGPFEFVTETLMGFDDFLTYIRSWSAYPTAKGKGLELLGEDVVGKFKLAWGEDGKKTAKFPVYLRIGRVRDAFRHPLFLFVWGCSGGSLAPRGRRYKAVAPVAACRCVHQMSPPTVYPVGVERSSDRNIPLPRHGYHAQGNTGYVYLIHNGNHWQ